MYHTFVYQIRRKIKFQPYDKTLKWYQDRSMYNFHFRTDNSWIDNMIIFFSSFFTVLLNKSRFMIFAYISKIIALLQFFRILQKITGRFCECTNFKCSRVNGTLCGGLSRGYCECNECQCAAGWMGDACNCRGNRLDCVEPGE